MLRTTTAILILGSIALTASAEANAQDSSDLARCVELENADARLACYDEALGRSKSPEQESTGSATASEPVPMTDEIGAEQLSANPRPENEPPIIHGRVTECKKDASRKYYFVFDNGQVWKQRANARLPVGGCDFAVTITKDAFGYKMQIEGEERWIRIGRIR